MPPSSISNAACSSENDNLLTLLSLPKKWIDFDTKKDLVHRVANIRHFETLLDESTEVSWDNPTKENRNSTSTKDSPFDTVVEVDNLDPNGLFVSLDLDLSWEETKKAEQKSREKYSRDLSIHLNREAMESAHRAIQRLEISVSKKIEPKSKKKRKVKAPASALRDGTNPLPATDTIVSPSRLIQYTDTIENGNNDDNHIEDIDTKEITTIELCRRLQSLPESKIGLDLSIPLRDEMSAACINEAPSHPARFFCRIRSNPPVILATSTFESFRSKLFVGIPIVVNTILLHATRAEISWFVLNGVNENGKEAEELVLRDSPSFIPKAHHVGKRLLVVVRPLRESKTKGDSYGKADVYIFHNVIQDFPRMPIVSPLRDGFIKGEKESDQKSMDTLRVCTYNILADLYVSRQGNGQDSPTTYSHVKYEHVEKARRIPMIVGELMAYQADIICLQEVDGSVYDAFLQPVLLTLGYDGYYSNKASSQREGCALFWSRNVLELSEASSFEVRDLFRPSSSNNEKDRGEWKSMREIYQLLNSHRQLKTVVVEKLGQILQIATLRLKNSSQGHAKEIVIANTHLFWHPMADHIRAMQVYVVAKKIDEVRQKTNCDNSLKNNHPPRPFLLCGDLNSDPLSGASQLLCSRSLAPDQHECWKYLHRYKWDIDDCEVDEMMEGGTSGEERRAEHRDGRCEQSISFAKSCNASPPHIDLPDCFPTIVSGCKESPPFTNFSLDFVDTLDYILASKASETELFGFVPMRSAAMPSVLDVKEFISMPNEFMPSDHVSIVCDFDLIRYD